MSGKNKIAAEAPSSSLLPVPETQLTAVKQFLDPVVKEVEVPEYMNSDPVGFMHLYPHPEDQNIVGFISALLAWGRRDIIMAKISDLLKRFGTNPADFTGNFSESDRKALTGFKHRTCNADDMYWIIRGISNGQNTYGSFENFWNQCYTRNPKNLLGEFHARFFDSIPDCPQRVRKHLSTPDKNSSCKRLCLYLRWAIRKNSCVDPGSMSFMPASELMIPLDVHVSRYARMLGLLTRRSNDWKAVTELTGRLRMLDPEDPVKYDYALFGLGIHQMRVPVELQINP
ncbi:TIGR02757 family protein [Balneolaceae bacterium ANBcel3]|nr:TIGR02757 family protein [Balneolaceae bacterium ANBcel3]